MAVTNRGSILISTANDIGSSLVDVIGGEGYTPNEWSKKINLCGIAAADVPTALENIEESTPSGTDRGSISLDTANAVGAVLNKKFNTARGFKPSEWASAISKLTELEVKTASGSVASFDDGADDVPLKSCTCEIVPQQDLHGYAKPWAPGAGSNLWNEVWELGAINITNGQNVDNNNFIRSKDYIAVEPSTTYYKCAPQNMLQLYYAADNSYIGYGSWGKNGTFTTPNNCYYVRFYVAQEYGTTYNNDIAINYPSSVTTYSPYSNICPITGTTEIEVTHTDGQNPPIESETKTAALGRTVYGGYVDVVSGILEKTNENFVFDGSEDENWVSAYSGGYYRYYIDLADAEVPESGRGFVLCNMGEYGTQAGSVGLVFRYRQSATTCRLYYYPVQTITTVTDFKSWLASNNLQVYCPLATPEEIDTEDTHEVESYLGANNIFSDVQGGTTTVEYRADIDLAAT